MDSAAWDTLRKNKQKAVKLLMEAKLSTALAQLKWSSLTKSDKRKIEGAAKGKGWHEEATIVPTRKGVRKIAKRHHEVAVKKEMQGVLDKPIVPMQEKKEVPEPTGYFTLKKAQDLIRENWSKLSDDKLHKKSIQLRDYINFIENSDEYSQKTLVNGGYYTGVVHPDATGMVPVDIWLDQNLKTALEELYKEQDHRKQEKEATVLKEKAKEQIDWQRINNYPNLKHWYIGTHGSLEHLEGKDKEHFIKDLSEDIIENGSWEKAEENAKEFFKTKGFYYNEEGKEVSVNKEASSVNKEASEPELQKALWEYNERWLKTREEVLTQGIEFFESHYFNLDNSYITIIRFDKQGEEREKTYPPGEFTKLWRAGKFKMDEGMDLIRTASTDLYNRASHRDVIELALKTGKEVPENVLKQFPDAIKRVKSDEDYQMKELREHPESAYPLAHGDPKYSSERVVEAAKKQLNDAKTQPPKEQDSPTTAYLKHEYQKREEALSSEPIVVLPENVSVIQEAIDFAKKNWVEISFSFKKIDIQIHYRKDDKGVPVALEVKTFDKSDKLRYNNRDYDMNLDSGEILRINDMEEDALACEPNEAWKWSAQQKKTESYRVWDDETNEMLSGLATYKTAVNVMKRLREQNPEKRLSIRHI